MNKKILTIFFLLCFGITPGQTDCLNNVQINQLGIEFCLPDLEWQIEEEDGLKFISFHKSTFYLGTDTYTLRMEKVAQSCIPKEYFDKDWNVGMNIENYKTTVITEGPIEINGKIFYYGKLKTNYNSNGKNKNSYSISYYYCENNVGYILSHVVSDETIDKWNEKESLSIFNTFKILKTPDLSILD